MRKQKKCRACKETFSPIVEWQIYCSKRCMNRAGQARLRKRAKLATRIKAKSLA